MEKFLKFFSVQYDENEIILTDGGNSVIMNRKFKYKEFIGHSVNEVAEAYAGAVGLKTKWYDE